MRFIIAVWAVLGMTVTAPCLTNVLENPSLEIDENGDGIPDRWYPNVHENEGAEGGIAIDTDVKHSGRASLRIDHTSDNTAWVRASQQPIPVRPEATYRARAWVRGDAPYSVIVYQFRTDEQPYVTFNIGQGEATDGWQELTKLVTAGNDAEFLKVSLIANGPGSVWFDDVSLELIAERPHIKAPRAPQPPTIDGDLADAAWRGAPTAGDFCVLDGQGETAPVQTTVRVAFDDRALYIAFECQEPNVPGILADATTDTSSVWADDCVEVFLDTEHDRASYLHLGVSAGGGKWQERTIATRWYTNWHSSGGRAPTPEWRAAARIGEDSWTAEIELPFAALGGAPRPGKVWGAQFCRTRRAGAEEQNATWSYTEGERYARPDRFGSLIFSVGGGAPPQVVRRQVNADDHEPTIIPQPVETQWTPGVFRLNAGTKIRIADPSQTAEAEVLQNHIRARYGLDIPIMDPAMAVQAGDVIDLGAQPSDTVPAGEEAYRLHVHGEGISLAARSPQARLYGVQTIRQMLAQDDRGPFCRRGVITDEPAMNWRGWHTSSPAAADIPAYKRLVDVLALLKFNTIVWEVNGNLEYETRPEIARNGAPTKAQLKDLVDYAKRRHFEVIPQLATFAHFGYVLNKPQYKHLAESQESTKGFRSLWNYCPSQPEVYEIVFDLMGELVEVFEPRYFHIGHDEASFDDIGVCPRCKDKDPWVLWAEDINKLDGWIKQRGMRTIMWGDQFLPTHNGRGHFNTANATDMVAKDILIFDWHYSPSYDFDASIDYFKEHGFEVVGCPWYEPVNVYDFASAAKRNDILGYCGTTWSHPPSTMRKMPHLPTAWIIGGENAWSPDAPELARIPYQPAPEFNRLWNLDTPSPAREFRLLDISGFCNANTVDSRRRDGWMGEGPQYDLRSLPTGVAWVGHIPFSIVKPEENHDRACIMLADETTPTDLYPEGVYEIAVGLKTPALYFLQTCSVPQSRERKLYATHNPGAVGHYIVNYADGEQAKIPLVYLANIHDWNGQRGPAQAVGVWEGRTEGGALISIGAVRWDNTRPDVAITSIDFASAVTQVRPVLLAVTAAREGE